MLNKLQNEWRSPIIFGTMAAMLLSMFFSRAALSASMVFFIIFSFFHKNIGLQLRNYVSSPLLLGISLLFFLPLFSGLWSGNKQEWLEILKIKLPLFLFPLAFASPFTLHAKQWLRLIVFFVILILAGTVWSMILYAADFDAINSGYLKANSMITPLKNDRIRFSLLVSIAALLSGRMFFTDRSANKKKGNLVVAAVCLVCMLFCIYWLCEQAL
ncbi:MAG: hypothetical protein IPM85_17850 [Chitinophagaceae bacterium]|nr:hypothetical protein [Chitinophagaceae bacterium]